MGCESRPAKVSQLGYMGLNLNHAQDLLVSFLPVDSTINEYLSKMDMAFLVSMLSIRQEEACEDLKVVSAHLTVCVFAALLRV